MENYPKTATERFDGANLHIKYCLSFIKKFIVGNTIEIGAGCGSFTRHYLKKKLKKLILTDLDSENILELKRKYDEYEYIKITNKQLGNLNEKFDTILYLHVLEHIKNDSNELKLASKKLNSNGHLIIIVPAYQHIYSNLDKAVGHFRRYERKFFKKSLFSLKRVKLCSVDLLGYFLYSLNRIFFKSEVFPSRLKIFVWDKIFTPITIFLDFITGYKFGKCLIAIYKKN